MKKISRIEIVQTVMLSAAVLCTCMVIARPGTWYREMSWIAVTNPGSMPEDIAQIDTLFRQQMLSGNIWLSFAGFRPDRPEDEYLMTRVYYRGNYDIFPRHIYVAGLSTVVNDGRAMAARRASPEAAVAERLGIRWKMRFSRDGPGKASLNIAGIDQ